MKVHIVSNPLNINSGFSVVAKNIALGLKKLGYEVDCTGQQQSYNPEVYFGIESLPLLGTSKDENSQLMSNILDTNPDIILNIFQADSGDFGNHAFMFDSANRLLVDRNTKIMDNENIEYEDKKLKKAIKSVWYTPIESLGLDYITKRDLGFYTQLGGTVVAQCGWGQTEMRKEGIVCNHVIYHGFDDKIFKPLEDNEIKKITCPVQILHYVDDDSNLGWVEEKTSPLELYNRYRNKFVFLVVANNLGVRKRLERAMKAYSIFVNGGSRQNRDRCHLHIHTHPLTTDGINLLDMAKRLGIEKDVTFSYSKWKSGWLEMAMSVLYNSCDCHLSASSGEGFGLSTLESMACGLPTIGPRNTSFVELVGDGLSSPPPLSPRGILVDGDYQYIIAGSYRFLVNEISLALAMEKMYKDDKLRERYGNNAAKWAKQYSWNEIVKRWDILFRSI